MNFVCQHIYCFLSVSSVIVQKTSQFHSNISFCISQQRSSLGDFHSLPRSFFLRVFCRDCNKRQSKMQCLMNKTRVNWNNLWSPMKDAIQRDHDRILYPFFFYLGAILTQTNPLIFQYECNFYWRLKRIFNFFKMKTKT